MFQRKGYKICGMVGAINVACLHSQVTKRVLLRLGVIKGIIPSKMELVLMSLLRVCEPSPSQVLSTASLCELENKKATFFLN